MKRDAVEEFVSGVVETIIESTELELVDVEYVHEREWYLRVFLDKEGSIDLDDCQMVSEKLSEVLDAKDPIKENYLLEVSSPGLDRVLKKEKDFIRYHGREVDIQLFKPIDGKKQYTGSLQGYSDDTITIRVQEDTIDLERAAIAQIRLHLDF